MALFAVSGILELGAWTESDDKEPGNFGNTLGLSQNIQEMRDAELHSVSKNRNEGWKFSCYCPSGGQ